MKRVQGIGGIFFKAKDPAKLEAWYDKHLGISTLSHSPWGADDTAPLFEWRDIDDAERKCYTVFGIFPADTDYFEPGTLPFMFNFRVDDLDAVLAALREEGVQIVGEIRDYVYGRFARIVDPEGNQIELWQPAEGF
ncbi:MAG: VOC family protein [Chloroflexi bacterium]|nr:MAG: VOC family protein [Chloroflexota bacterium]